MDFIPTYMLKRIYVEGSLKNVDCGFEFQMTNNIAPGTLTGLKKIEVDGKVIEADKIMVGKKEATMKASECSYQKPIYFNMGDVLVIRALGETLPPGKHDLVLTVSVAEIGNVNVPISDTIQ